MFLETAKDVCSPCNTSVSAVRFGQYSVFCEKQSCAKEVNASKQVICQYTVFHADVLIPFPVISRIMLCPECQNQKQYDIALLCAAGEASVSSTAFYCVGKTENRGCKFC